MAIVANKSDWIAMDVTTVTTAITCKKGTGLFTTGSAPADDLDCLDMNEGDVVTVEAGVTPYVKAHKVNNSATFVAIPIGV